MGTQRTIGAGGPSRGVDQLLQYWRQVLDQDQRPVEIKQATAKGQAKQESAAAQTAAIAEESGWDRHARALEQAGALDQRSQRWSSFTTSAPSASAERQIQGTPHRAIPEAPIGRGTRRSRSADGSLTAQAGKMRAGETPRTGKLGIRPVTVHRPQGAFGPSSGSAVIV